MPAVKLSVKPAWPKLPIVKSSFSTRMLANGDVAEKAFAYSTRKLSQAAGTRLWLKKL
jgi:hypothetical protein